MKLVLASLFLVTGCAGPGQAALAKTPTATTKRTPSTAPAASTSDQEREQLTESNESIQDAGNAYGEAAASRPEKPSDAPPGPVQPKMKPASPDKP